MTLEEAKAELAALEKRYEANEGNPEWVEVHGMTLGSEMIALRESIRVAEATGSKTVTVREGR